MTPGAEARRAFSHDPTVAYLNHGSFGSPPQIVVDARRRLLDAQARDPLDFVVRRQPGLLRGASEALSTYVGAAPEDIVWVDNATTGINAILRGLELREGDELVTTSHVYNAVYNALRYVAERAGAQLRVVEVPFPPPADDVIVDALRHALSTRTRVVVLDHIASRSGFRFPIEALVDVCRRAGVPTLVDAAHALGQDTMALGDLGATWVVANAHKWLYTPLSAAMLWTTPEAQHTTLPLTLSHGYGAGYIPAFDYTGTRDISAAAVVPDALAFIDALGGHEALSAYTRALAEEGAKRCARAWDVAVPLPAERRRNLVTLPWPHPGPVTDDHAHACSQRLWDMHRIVVPVLTFQGRLWIRLSAAAYNTEDDYRRLADAVLHLN